MKHATKALAALGAAAALTIATAAPAFADPWDGGYIDFGLGEWEFYASPLTLDDVELVFPDTSTEYTDIWDGMGYIYLTSADAGLVDENLRCEPNSAVDVSTDAVTGDLLFACTATNGLIASSSLVANVEYRVYSTSDLVRVSVELVNTGDLPITMDDVTFATDFGSSGDLWNYQGQDDAVLPVPATENSTSMDALNGAGSRWMVHFEDDDAPGGLAWGSANAAAPASLTELSGDYSEATVSPFAIPAGESRTVAYFALWNPATLISLDYTNDSGHGQAEAADALVPLMSEFDSFSGRLTVGLEGQQVVNWGPVTEAAKPELAATGSTVDATPALAAGALLLGGALVLGYGVRRRMSGRQA